MRGREQFEKYRVPLYALAKVFRRSPSWVVRSLESLSTYMGGRRGLALRYAVARANYAEVGDNVLIARGVIVKFPELVSIGSNVSIQENCYIDGCGGVEIGNDVSIAHGCSIMSSNHTWTDHAVPIRDNAVEPSATKIGSDVWLGCGVRVLAGVEIASRVVVAAGAVVTGPLESNTLYGGIPARKLKALD